MSRLSQKNFYQSSAEPQVPRLRSVLSLEFLSLPQLRTHISQRTRDMGHPLFLRPLRVAGKTKA
jgi:hypothetical protein